MKPAPLVLGLVLAIASFAYGRHHYRSDRSVSITNPFNKNQTKTFTVAEEKLFGEWMKDEWLFAIALPSAFLAGGVALSLKK